jgi:hypothetical protein
MKLLCYALNDLHRGWLRRPHDVSGWTIFQTGMRIGAYR